MSNLECHCVAHLVGKCLRSSFIIRLLILYRQPLRFRVSQSHYLYVYEYCRKKLVLICALFLGQKSTSDDDMDKGACAEEFMDFMRCAMKTQWYVRRLIRNLIKRKFSVPS